MADASPRSPTSNITPKSERKTEKEVISWGVSGFYYHYFLLFRPHNTDLLLILESQLAKQQTNR